MAFSKTFFFESHFSIDLLAVRNLKHISQTQKGQEFAMKSLKLPRMDDAKREKLVI